MSNRRKAGAARRAGVRPAPRTVEVAGTGDWATWSCTARADFPARVLELLEKMDLPGIVAAMDLIVVDHNFPDSLGAVATSMADVDPYQGTLHMAGRILDAIGKLPNR